MTGIEQPLGPLTHKFVRSEFQPNSGGLQHYHCLLATLLDNICINTVTLCANMPCLSPLCHG